MARRMVENFCWAVLGIALLFVIATYIYGWHFALTQPLAISYEGPNYWLINELANGRNIYDSNTLKSPPWSVTIYTPIFLFITACFQKLVGFNYWSGRLVSIVSFCAMTVGAFRVFRVSGNCRLVSAVALTNLVTFFIFWRYSYYARVDALAMAFALFSIERFIAWYSRSDGSKTSISSATVSMLPSILLGLASIYTKQPYLAVPATICTFLLAKRRFRDTLIYGVSTAVGGLFIAFVLNVLTAGGFLEHMRFTSHMPFAVESMMQLFDWFGYDLTKLAALPVVAFAWLFAKRKTRDDLILLPIVLTVASGALVCYTMSTLYPNTNHAMLLFFAITWWTAQLTKPFPNIASLFLTLPILISTAFLAALLWFQPIICTREEREFQVKTKQMQEQMQMPGELVYCQDPAFALGMQAKPAYVDLASLLQVWKALGTYEEHEKEVIDSLRKQRYRAVMIDKTDTSGVREEPYWWSNEFVKQVKANYKLKSDVLGNGTGTDFRVPVTDATESAAPENK